MMQVILLKDIAGVGQRDTVKEVADGYAFNSLIPRGLAEQATPEKLKALEAKARVSRAKKEESAREWTARLRSLDGATIVIAAKANDQGHLYRQLSPGQIVEQLRKEKGITFEPQMLSLGEAIKTTGEFPVEVEAEVASARLNVRVVPEKD